MLAEFEYDHDIVSPGLKEYTREGALITDYPEFRFREAHALERSHRVALIIFTMPGTPGTKYYLKTRSNGQEGRIYLISEGGSASIRRFVLPGTTLNEKVEIITEIPTALGNVLVKHADYHLLVSNPY